MIAFAPKGKRNFMRGPRLFTQKGLGLTAPETATRERDFAWLWVTGLLALTFAALLLSAAYLRRIEAYNFGVERGYLSSDSNPDTFLSKESDLHALLGHMEFALDGSLILNDDKGVPINSLSGSTPANLMKPAAGEANSPVPTPGKRRRLSEALSRNAFLQIVGVRAFCADVRRCPAGKRRVQARFRSNSG